MSIHEEGTVGVMMPMMGVFNNLVLFDQHVPQNSLQSIVPELATSWAWSEDGKELTFKLRDGVKWHDGRPFTAADVKCTFDLLTNQGKEKFRLNYRETWWVNVESTTTNGDREVFWAPRSTTPMSTSIRITSADRRAITWVIVTKILIRWSTSNRWSPIRPSARSLHGR